MTAPWGVGTWGMGVWGSFLAGLTVLTVAKASAATLAVTKPTGTTYIVNKES